MLRTLVAADSNARRALSVAIVAMLLSSNATQGQESEEDFDGLLSLKCQSLTTESSNESSTAEVARGFGFHPQYLVQDLGPEMGLLTHLILPWIVATVKIVSFAASLTTFILLGMARLPNSPRVIAQKHRSLTFFLGHLFFYIDGHVIEVPCYLCVTAGILSNYFLISTFTWNLVEGYLLFNALVRKRPMEKNSSALSVMAFSYGLPLLSMAIVLTAVHFGALGLGEETGHSLDSEIVHCWIRSEVYLWGFVLPIMLTVSINICILMAVLHSMSNRIPTLSRSVSQTSESSLQSRIVRQDTSSKGGNVIMKHARILLILTFLLGINGGVSIMKVLVEHWLMYFLGTTLCSSSGIFFFVHSIMLNDTVKTRLTSTMHRKSFSIREKFATVIMDKARMENTLGTKKRRSSN